MSESSGLLIPAAPSIHPTSQSPAGLPDVSVCIASWNCRELLQECLNSLDPWLQRVRMEIIVVDNGSTDGAAEMVAKDFPDVVLQRNRVNRGFAAASNQAAHLARGRYLLFLNNDTYLPRETLLRLLDHAEAHPEVGMIGPCLRGTDGQVQISSRPRPTVATFLHRTCLLRWTGLFRSEYRRYRRDACLDEHGPRYAKTLMGAALLVRSDVFEECGGWDEDYAFGGEDFDLSTRIGKRYPLVYLPDVAIIHHGRASTRLNVAYSAPNVAVGFARYLRKSGSSRLALWFYKAVVTLDAPLHLLVKASQWGWRQLTRQPRKARQSWQRVKEQWYFLTRGLLEFWRV